MKSIAGVSIVMLGLLCGCVSNQAEMDQWVDHLWTNFGGKADTQQPDLNAGGGGGNGGSW